MDGFFGRQRSGAGYGLDSQDGAWPAGEHAASSSDSPWLLLGASRDNAQRALDLYVSSERLDLLQAAVAVGAAVELAIKASLATIEPVLLAEKGHVDSVLRLTGHRELAGTSATRVRTLGTIEACRLARKLGRAVAATDSDVDEMMVVRNAATHMALVDQRELRSSIPIMTRIVDSLVSELGEARDAFWGSRLSLANELIEARLQEVAQIVSAKLAAAKLELDRLTSGLDNATKQLILAARSTQRIFVEHEEPTTCPVCNQQAWLSCGVEETPPEFDGESMCVPRTAFPVVLHCTVCNLLLEGSDELAVLHLDSDIQLGPRDPDDPRGLLDEIDFEPPDRGDD